MSRTGRIIGYTFVVLFFFSQAYEVANSSCRLEVYLILDDSYCVCQKGLLDPYRVCHGGGSKTLLYWCSGPSSCLDTGCGVYVCTADLVTTVAVLLSQTPNCNDVGWWPIGPECNEQSDCQITGWTDNYGPHSGCKCAPS